MPVTILSLGAGVQSTTLALMAAHGEIGPMPEAAIFADTGDEPQAVYRHLEWLESVLPFPVHRTRRAGGSLSEHLIRAVTNKETRTAAPPLFTKNPDGMLPRQCSSEFKVRPITAKVRELLGDRYRRGRPGQVTQWIGISLDEAIRMKPSRLRYIVNRWPLIELRMSRRDCLKWLSDRDYPVPPKSACVFCPYHGREQWRTLRDRQPEDWQRAVALDTAIRPGFRGMTGETFVHMQRVPLDQVDLSTPEERGQLNLFLNDCEGVCGV